MYKQKSPARVSGKNKIPEGFTPRDSLGGRKTSTPSCPLQKKRLPERDFESSEQPSKKQSSNRERQPNLSVAEVDPTLLGHGLLFKAPSNETQGKKKSAELMEGLAGGSSPTHISTVEVKVEKPAEKTYELPFTVYQKFQRRIGSEAAHDSSDELEVTNVPTNSIFHRRKNPVAAESDLAPTEWVRQKQKNEDLELEYFRRGSFLLDDAPDIFFTFGPDGTFEVHGKGLPWKKGTFSSKDIKEVSVAKTFDYIYIQLQTKYHEIPHGDSIVMKLKTSNEASIREIFKKHGIEMRENLYIWNKEQSFKESKQLEDDDIFPICNKEVCSRSPTEREPMRRGPPVAPRTRRSKNTPLSKNSAIEMELEREVPSTQRTIHGQVETHEQELGRHSRASTPPEWKTPLVWPPAAAAKKRVTVDYADLDRLDNEKWLNDNIINFYLRHLEEELSQQNPVLAQQTHFFNTFFYERLISRTADRRIHWYLAIICNLHHLEKRIPRTLEDSKDTVGTPVTQIEEDNIDSDISSECLADETVDITQRRDAESVTLQRPTTAEEQILSEASVIEPDSTDGHMDISKLRELDDKEWPNENGIEGEPNFQFNTQLHEKHEAEEIIHISGDDFEKRPAKRLKKSAKPKKPVKVDFERPTIFILDSLNKNSHSRTFTVLKEYIQEVALQTKGWEFSAKNHIAGSYAAVVNLLDWS
ncbi:hypothetical protein BDZ91DRAFT_417403 [Kalaharituber pfeilii]|nr:hypothetical protein BDZ91DRAFT_417403 [Kalaharituber pfeilii]